jgi:hypothetical protein
MNVHLEITIQDDKTLTLGTVGQVVTDLNLKERIVEELVESVDTQLTESYCGEKYEHGNGEKRYQRGGTTTRTATTTAGEHEFTLHTVEDTAEESYFRPVEDAITLDGKKHYQADVSMDAVELATKMSYRDAAAEGELFTPMPSPSTINRRVIEYGEELQQFNREHVEDRQATCVQADGTKSHSQEDDQRYNTINVAMADDGDGELLDVRVDDSWKATAEDLDVRDAVADEATIVSDAEQKLVNAFITEDRTHQLDLVHLVRTTAYKLWEDEELSLEDRERVVESLENVIYPLASAVEWFRETDEPAEPRVRERMNETVETLQQVATNLDSIECSLAAEYLRECSNRAVTFARLALEDVHVPWTSNRVERLMGEISKRCKHKWMRWTARGQEAILRLLLTRYTKEPRYEAFRAEITRQADQSYISTEVRVEHARGKF